MYRIPSLPSRARENGFTLVELLVVVVIIGILAAIAVPIFLNQKSNAQDAKAKNELAIVSKHIVSGLSVGYVPVEGPAVIDIPALGSVTGPASSATVGSTPTHFCVRTLSETGTVFYYDSLDGYVETPPNFCELTLIAPSTGEGESATVDTGNTDSAILSGEGTFTDTSTGTVLQRTSTGVVITTSAANWESISVEHSFNGNLMTDTVQKTGASPVGVLTRVSNTRVDVALPAGASFVVTIQYNGKSTGTFYTFS